MTYAVKEIFYTLQGEGAQAGRAAVFCRFAGCNLWSGRERDRASAICQFCDTDFADTDGAGGGRFESAEALAAAVKETWLRGIGKEATAGPSPTPPAKRASGSAQDDNGLRKFVVCTGGEPLLQLDERLIDALHACDFEIAVETNGTIAAPAGLDWLCVSPKAGALLVQESGDELKLVYPQTGFNPADLGGLAFRHFFLQPMDGPDRGTNTELALRYCMQHPQWRLSLQTHKMLGIP
jgi:7-carboxy-7-deazaguanine synthase (Cx14CxxC type)